MLFADMIKRLFILFYFPFGVFYCQVSEPPKTKRKKEKKEEKRPSSRACWSVLAQVDNILRV